MRYGAFPYIGEKYYFFQYIELYIVFCYCYTCYYLWGKKSKNAEQEVVLEVVMNSREFNSSIFTGGKSQWLSEWAGHNALYEANIFRDHTGSVDVNELE